ncbi:MAG: hypothetical protein KBT35_07675 [Firmicutes bacterium]|nr:hypothetical protein [Candidatus Colivicinus equi]
MGLLFSLAFIYFIVKYGIRILQSLFNTTMFLGKICFYFIVVIILILLTGAIISLLTS